MSDRVRGADGRYAGLAPSGALTLAQAREKAAQLRKPVVVDVRGSGGDLTAGRVPVVLGRTEPRLWTRPLRELTPETSFGYAVVDFAREVLGFPVDPWQEWVLIHAGELLPDGRPRFRKVLVLVSRQNGKSQLAVVLSLYWLFVEQVALVLGTSTKLPYAAESWKKAIRLAQARPDLAAEIPTKRSEGGVRNANGTESLTLRSGSRYLIAASNAEGGRSLTIDRLILDELRQHHDYSAWDAAVPATNAVADAQVWALSNAGSDRSVVLNGLREAALAFIDSGDGDDRLGLFEYSAPDGSRPDDVEALAQANPNLGRRLALEDLLGEAKVAIREGGEKLAGFKTENMCMRVKLLDPAIDPEAWTACLVPGDLSGVRSRIALCLDVALDGQHATLCAAAVLPDGRVRVEEVASWSGVGCTQAVRRDLPGWVTKVRPQAFGWLPAGPAAALAADLADRKGRAWPPPGVKVEEIRGETTATCMGFVQGIVSGQILHAGQELLSAQVAGTEKLFQGDAYRFARKGAGHCDAVYAAAGAVHLCRVLPKSVGKPRIVAARSA